MSGKKSEGRSGEVMAFHGGSLRCGAMQSSRGSRCYAKGLNHPDFILTHHHDDAHENHRRVSADDCRGRRTHPEATVFLNKRSRSGKETLAKRMSTIPVFAEVLRRKMELLNMHFGFQRSKQWFDFELFSDWLDYGV